MGDYNYYASMASKLNNPDASLQEIEGWFTQANPSSPNWKPPYIDVTKPMLKSNDQLLDEFGLDKSKYSVEGLQNTLNEQTYKAYNGLNDSLFKARHKANVLSAENYRGMSDTINAKYSQGIDLGINRAMDQANLLSTMIGTSQAGQRTIQEIDTQLGNSQNILKESLVGNKQKAHESYDSLHAFLAKTAEQLYKEDVKRQEAEEEYNKKLSYMANDYENAKGLSEMSYYANITNISNAIYSNNQKKLSAIGKAAQLAEASDKLSAAYIDAARRNAEASVNSAGKHGYTTYTTTLNLSMDIAKILSGDISDRDLEVYSNAYKELEAMLRH